MKFNEWFVLISSQTRNCTIMALVIAFDHGLIHFYYYYFFFFWKTYLLLKKRFVTVRWVWTMPLGSPVVPLENINQANESMSTSTLSGHSISSIGYQTSLWNHRWWGMKWMGRCEPVPSSLNSWSIGVQPSLLPMIKTSWTQSSCLVASSTLSARTLSVTMNLARVRLARLTISSLRKIERNC